MRMKKVLYTAVTAAAATMLIAGYCTSKSEADTLTNGSGADCPKTR